MNHILPVFLFFIFAYTLLLGVIGLDYNKNKLLNTYRLECLKEKGTFVPNERTCKFSNRGE
jgi:hypothetical protein